MKQLPPTAFIVCPLSSSCIVGGYVHLMNTEYSQPAPCDINCRTFSVDQLMKLELCRIYSLKGTSACVSRIGISMFLFQFVIIMC